MPRITRWFIKSGMIWFSLGIILTFVAEVPGMPAGSLLLPVYWHLIVIGWVTQVIMGVAIWMFPRKRRDRKKDVSILARGAFWLLNAGLIIRFLSEPFLPMFTENLLVKTSVILSAVLQVAAVCCFVMEIWPRVQPKKKRKRERS